MNKTMTAVALAVVMVLVLVVMMDVRAQQALNDGQILALFDEANTTDIWTARLALAKSQTPDVRTLASMVVGDHESVQHTARELAKKLRVIAAPPADDSSADALAAAIKNLQAKSGADFDRAYIVHELAFHQAAIEAARGTLLPAAKNDELKALLKSVLGGFEHHLAETRRVAARLGVR